jgi:histidinol-phosphate phosphatase family protein
VSRAIFLDRDGTLIVDTAYPKDPALVEPLPGAADALRELQRHFLLVLVSNQSGIGRGLIRPEEAQAVHARVMQVFAKGGVRFADAFYCPHAPGEGCACRKPAPGMLLDAAAAHAIDLARSVMIGDKASDVAAGRAAGVGHAIRFGPDADGETGDALCEDWPAVVRYVARLIE